MSDNSYETKLYCVQKLFLKNESTILLLKYVGFYLESIVVLFNISYSKVKIILILTINIIENRFFNQVQLNESKNKLGKENWWLGMQKCIKQGLCLGHSTHIRSSLCYTGRAVHFCKV